MDGTEDMKDRTARMTNLANAEALDYVDWLEITQVGRGQHGMYVVSKKGVRPQKFAQDFLDTLPGVTVFERVPLTGSDDAVLRVHSLPRQQEVEALRAIEECPWTLRFPCTPGELLEFVDRAEYGGRHFSVPQAFRDAVEEAACHPPVATAKSTGVSLPAEGEGALKGMVAWKAEMVKLWAQIVKAKKDNARDAIGWLREHGPADVFARSKNLRDEFEWIDRNGATHTTPLKTVSTAISALRKAGTLPPKQK